MGDEFFCCYFCQSFFFLLFPVAIAAVKDDHLEVVLCLKQFRCCKEYRVSEVGCPLPSLPWAEGISEGYVPTSFGRQPDSFFLLKFSCIVTSRRVGLAPFHFLPLWSPVTTSRCPSIVHLSHYGTDIYFIAMQCRWEKFICIEHNHANNVKKKEEEHCHHVCSSQIASLQKRNVCTQCCPLWTDFLQSLFECR